MVCTFGYQCSPPSASGAHNGAVTARHEVDPNRPIVGIDHVALRVRSLDDAVALLTDTFGFVETSSETMSNGVRVRYVSAGNLDFEVFESTDGEPGIDHLALRVTSASGVAELLTLRGLDVGTDDIQATRGALARLIAPDSVGGLRMHLCEPRDEHKPG